jgi:uncharacterized integral membrane protein
MTEKTPMSTCPMAETCKGMMEKPASSFWMIIPGLMFVVLGALIVMGVAMLMMVNFMRRIGKRVQNRPG